MAMFGATFARSFSAESPKIQSMPFPLPLDPPPLTDDPLAGYCNRGTLSHPAIRRATPGSADAHTRSPRTPTTACSPRASTPPPRSPSAGGSRSPTRFSPRASTPPPGSSPRRTDAPSTSSSPPLLRRGWSSPSRGSSAGGDSPLRSPSSRRSPSPPLLRRSPSPTLSETLNSVIRDVPTGRTVAGRARLGVQDDNWKHAARERQMRDAREHLGAARVQREVATNVHGAAAQRATTKVALLATRSQQRREVARAGHEVKRQAEECRVETAAQRAEWAEYGRQLTHAFDNRGARASREQLQRERVASARRQKAERAALRLERMVEMHQKEATNRRSAERIRHELGAALSSVAAREAVAREASVDEMRCAEELRRLERAEEQLANLLATRRSHDAVAALDHTSRVRRLRCEERGRRAAGAAAEREKLARLRVAHEASLQTEHARRRAAHDAVLAERIHGLDPHARAEERAGCVARIALLEDRANVPLPDGTGHPDYVAELAAYGVLGPELDVA